MDRFKADMKKFEQDMEKMARDMRQMDTNFIIRDIKTIRGSAIGGNGNDRKSISVSLSSRRNGGPRIIIRERMEDGEIQRYQPQNNRYSRNSITLGFGLTNYVSPEGKFPDTENKWYGLNPAGSRYFSLGWKWGHRFRTSRLGFNYGFEFAWQNFMLEDAYRFKKGDSALEFEDYRAKPDGKTVQKSKLVQCNLKIPVSIALRIGKTWFAEVGGFGGYRIDSYTKFKYDQRGNSQKDRERRNYYLNNLQYGVTAQIRNKGWGVFGEYHLNQVFSDKGPKLNAMQFGVSYWGI
jgi:hypothetical protein